jgi:hypothetical protein
VERYPVDQSGQNLGCWARFGWLHHPCKMNEEIST